MKNIFYLFLTLAMTFSFFSCKEEGPSMNEDYAGTWYKDLSAENVGILKTYMTDITFENSTKANGASEYVFNVKGTLTKISDGAGVSLVTHEWNKTTNSWDEETASEDAFTYSRSADGTTLEFGFVENTAILSSIEP